MDECAGTYGHLLIGGRQTREITCYLSGGHPGHHKGMVEDQDGNLLVQVMSWPQSTSERN